MKIIDIFDLNQGHQITDKEIYENEGVCPIFTSRNDIKGYWDKTIISKEDLPCITYPTKANIGNAYVQYDLFDANNTAILIPKPEWKDKIDLEWFKFKLRAIFLNVQTSKGGVSYLNRNIVEEQEIHFPDLSTQKKEFLILNEINSKQYTTEKILKLIEKITFSEFICEYEKYQAVDVPVNEIFDFVSGNSGLTEEYIYSLLDNPKEKEYDVLTGSVDVNNSLKVFKCRHPKNSNKLIKVYSGEGIHVVRKGKAGHINYLENGKYTLNDDAYLIYLKNSNYDINLKWIIYTKKELFRTYSSSSDNGTWSKDAFFEHGKIDIPSRAEQDKIVSYFDKIENYNNKLLEIKHKIDLISEKDLQ